MEATTAIGLAGLAAIAGIAMLRYAWSRPKRSLGLNLAGWALLLAAAFAGAQAGGAWGVAVASLFGMTGATVALAVEASRSERKRTKASNRRVNLLPESGEPSHIGRRVVTFLVSVPLALASSIALALGLRALALLGGWGEADANALALFSVPLVWGILAFILLMGERRRTQFATLALCGLALVFAFVPGA